MSDDFMAARRAEWVEKATKLVHDKRYAVVRRCVCPPDDMGWGCCCPQPLIVQEDPEGDFMLVRADSLLWSRSLARRPEEIMEKLLNGRAVFVPPTRADGS